MVEAIYFLKPAWCGMHCAGLWPDRAYSPLPEPPPSRRWLFTSPAAASIQRYLGKISGPLLDRIDLHIEVPAVPYKELRGKDSGATSAEMRARVEAARRIQRERGFYNAQIPHASLRTLCALDEAGERTLEMAVRRMSLSAHAHDRILKVARTIADLDNAEGVSAKHLAEAVQYRSLDRTYWS